MVEQFDRLAPCVLAVTACREEIRIACSDDRSIEAWGRAQ